MPACQPKTAPGPAPSPDGVPHARTPGAQGWGLTPGFWARPQPLPQCPQLLPWCPQPLPCCQPLSRCPQPHPWYPQLLPRCPQHLSWCPQLLSSAPKPFPGAPSPFSGTSNPFPGALSLIPGPLSSFLVPPAPPLVPPIPSTVPSAPSLALSAPSPVPPTPSWSSQLLPGAPSPFPSAPSTSGAVPDSTPHSRCHRSLYQLIPVLWHQQLGPPAPAVVPAGAPNPHLVGDPVALGPVQRPVHGAELAPLGLCGRTDGRMPKRPEGPLCQPGCSTVARYRGSFRGDLTFGRGVTLQGAQALPQLRAGAAHAGTAVSQRHVPAARAPLGPSPLRHQ